MEKSKQDFWKALTEPIFTSHRCDSCARAAPCCEFEKTCGILNPIDLKNPKNKWIWDGETLDKH